MADLASNAPTPNAKSLNAGPSRRDNVNVGSKIPLTNANTLTPPKVFGIVEKSLKLMAQMHSRATDSSSGDLSALTLTFTNQCYRSSSVHKI